jgi:hypothetical protein
MIAKTFNQQLADFYGCLASEIHGKIENLLLAAENDELTVYWGCISQEVLDTVI